MELRFELDEGGIAPTKAHPTDAGFDLYAPNFTIEQKEEMSLWVTGDIGGIPNNTVRAVDLDLDTKVSFGYSLDEAFEEGEVAIIDTKVHILIPEGYVGLILPRSSMNLRGVVVTATGVIDAGYTGTIKVAFLPTDNVRYHRDESQTFELTDVNPGDRIAQLVILPLPQFELQQGNVTGIKTARGNGGFGSTGK